MNYRKIWTNLVELKIASINSLDKICYVEWLGFDFLIDIECFQNNQKKFVVEISWIISNETKK